MDVFCFLRAKSRLMLGTFFCAIIVSFTTIAAAQSSSSDAGSPTDTPPINSPQAGSVSSGNYVPPVPPSGPDVYYDRPWDLYAGMTYTNFLAGPRLIQRSNLGGWEAQGSYWHSWHWGLMVDARQYIGTSGVFPNTQQNGGHITGPRIMQYYFMAGPEYRFIRRRKASATVHAIFGQAYGIFDAAHLVDVRNVQDLGLFATQWTFAAAVGGTFDYNFTPHIALRVQPEILDTRYGGTSQQNFGFSVGPLIRLGKVNKERYQ